MAIAITDLTELTTPADGDILPIVDVSASATKKITRQNLFLSPPLPNDSVTPAMWTNPYKFSAYRAANYTSATAAFGKVPIDTEISDPNSNFDTTNNRFVAPFDGDYFFIANTLTGANTTNRYLAALYKNGTAAKYGNDITGSGGGVIIGVNVSGLISLAATDYVEFFLFASAATTMAGDAGLSTHFQGFIQERT